MKVKIQVDPTISEEYAEFHVREITDNVSRFAEIIEKSNSVLTGTDEFERTIIIKPDDIVAVHADKKWCRILTETAEYSC